MSTFTLRLQDSTRIERIDQVESFVGEDASGSFGILAGHARFITCLGFGLARFRLADGTTRYLAIPGALVSFRDGELILSTRHYLMDEDYARISAAMSEQLLAEETALRSMKQSLRRMEEEVFRRMWRLGQS